METKENGTSRGVMAAGLLMGGAIGATVGILLAPKAGSQTRAELKQQGGKLRTRAGETVAIAKVRLGPAIETARSRVGSRFGRTPVEDPEQAEDAMVSPEPEKIKA